MGCRGALCCMFFLLCLLLGSDSSIATKPPLETNWKTEKQVHTNKRLFESSTFTTQLDTIPIINPTTPTTTTPIINPTNPFPPTTTTPINPFPPTTTTPINPFPPTTTTTSPPPPTPQFTGQPSTSTGSWCIASSTASETALQVALDYACGYGGADCSALQPGATCYNPNTLRDHASYAFNDYYQKNPVPNSCSFGGTAQLTNTDPSSGSCRFSTSKKTPSISPPSPPMTPTPMNPTPMSPPTTITNPSPFIPNSPTTDGFDPSSFGEPTSSPNSAVSMSCNFILLFTMTSLMTFLSGA